LAAHYRNLIVTLAARHKLPVVSFERAFIAACGLISYRPGFVDQLQRAAGPGPLSPDVNGAKADAIGGGAAEVRLAAAPCPQLEVWADGASRRRNRRA
jgi:hypothetical protein